MMKMDPFKTYKWLTRDIRQSDGGWDDVSVFDISFLVSKGWKIQRIAERFGATAEDVLKRIRLG